MIIVNFNVLTVINWDDFEQSTSKSPDQSMLYFIKNQ